MNGKRKQRGKIDALLIAFMVIIVALMLLWDMKAPPSESLNESAKVEKKPDPLNKYTDYKFELLQHGKAFKHGGQYLILRDKENDTCLLYIYGESDYSSAGMINYECPADTTPPNATQPSSD